MESNDNTFSKEKSKITIIDTLQDIYNGFLTEIMNILVCLYNVTTLNKPIKLWGHGNICTQ